MTVTDTLARIDYVLMAESNVAGAEWLLEEFEAKWDHLGEWPPGVYIRPMIELVDDHACFCDNPKTPDWYWSRDAYHSCGDVACTQCGRTVHELDARNFGPYGSEFHAGDWFCLDCKPLPFLLPYFDGDDSVSPGWEVS